MSRADSVATADRKPDKLPTTLSGAPVVTVPPGPLPGTERAGAEGSEEGHEGEGSHAGTEEEYEHDHEGESIADRSNRIIDQVMSEMMEMDGAEDRSLPRIS
jgi:hypothetical protein